MLQNIILNVFSFNIVAMMFGNGSGFPEIRRSPDDVPVPHDVPDVEPGHRRRFSTVFMGMMLAVVFLWYALVLEGIQRWLSSSPGAFAILNALPILWMLWSSLMGNSELMQGRVFPSPYRSDVSFLNR